MYDDEKCHFMRKKWQLTDRNYNRQLNEPNGRAVGSLEMSQAMKIKKSLKAMIVKNLQAITPERYFYQKPMSVV